MNSMEIDLWSRIDGYAFDTVEAVLPFSARLARDNNWSVNFAKRAIEEYKKFVFLAMTAGHPVTPSDEVDQVWHLHLLYTRSYWDDFCKILGGPLHHSPTQGGAHESSKFNIWYERTLRSYVQVFGTAPPSDIWPEPKTRFGDASHFRRINARAYWMVPKLQLSAPWILITIVTPLVWLAGCGGMGENDVFGALFFLFVLGIMLISGKNNKNDKGNGGGGGGCGAGGSGDGGGCGGCGGCGG